MKRGRHGKAEEEKKNRSGSRKAWKRGNGEAKTREEKKKRKTIKW